LARIDHTWPSRNGGFAPVSLPLFQAARRGLTIGDDEMPSFMVGLLLRDRPACYDGYQLVDFAAASDADLP
jgi:hypothetical protein